MTSRSADILAAARLNPVGPYLTPKDEWLKGWTGPAEWLDTFRDTDGRWVVSAYGAGGMANGAPAERLRLDTRRPEVRHRLCDLGVAPEWARKSAVACWCAGMGVDLDDVLTAWRMVANDDPDTGETWVRGRWYDPKNRGGGLWCCSDDQPWRSFCWGASVVVDPTTHMWLRGPETGALGRACADVAALRARCILAEKDGLYVPLADGGIGWWGHG